MKTRPSSIAWMLCLLIGISLAGIYLANKSMPPAGEASSYQGVGGPFTLTDQNGRPVTEKSWSGKYLLVYFGFTHCPDVCPTGLNRIAEALNALPSQTIDKIQPIFITVDPARDKVEDLKTYVALFHPKLIGLTGTETQIEQVESAYKVYAQKQGDGPDYMVNHSAFTYLQDPYGKVIALFSHEITAEEMAKQISTEIK
jgi:protein SCO1/2